MRGPTSTLEKAREGSPPSFQMLVGKRVMTPRAPEGESYLLVYGTLLASERPKDAPDFAGRAELVEARTIRGELHDLGEYPAFTPGASPVRVELYRIRDPGLLDEIDRYEGFDAADPSGSLYVRTPFPLPRYRNSLRQLLFGRPILHAWIYSYARAVPPDRRIPSGSWERHRRSRR